MATRPASRTPPRPESRPEPRPESRTEVRARIAAPEAPPKPGRHPEKPLCVLYEEGAHTVCAMLVHPSRPDTRIESARGKHAAMGVLMDDGYRFSTIRIDVPEWAAARVPGHCTILGFAGITSAPFK